MRHGEIREELIDLFDPHFLGMTLVMEDDEASDPLHVGFFCAEAIVSGAQSVTHLFQEFGLLRCYQEVARETAPPAGDRDGSRF